MIAKFSESKTTKGVFYVITEGEGVSKTLMHDYGGEGGEWT